MQWCIEKLIYSHIVTSLKNLDVHQFISLLTIVPILLTWFFLLIFWLFAIYSVSIFESFDLTLDFVESGLREEPSNYYYFFEQVLKFIVWLVLAWIVRFIPLSVVRRWKYIVFAWSLLLVALLFTPLWITLNGSSARLDVPWWTIQPWEFYKIWFVLFLSSWLLRKRDALDELSYFLGFGVMVALLCGVFLFIPDLWTLFVLWIVALVMYWYAGWKGKYILLSLVLWVWLLAIAATQFSYINRRVTYFISPESDTTWRGIWRQTRQSLIAVWWWGWVGKWYGKWLQKFGYIPEAQSDFIFAALSEEIWFIWNSVLLTLYFLLAYYFLMALPKVKNEYNKMIWVWFIAMIIIQVFINIWVNIKIMPLTWLTLPFVSHWWSALIVNMLELILLQKIIMEK